MKKILCKNCKKPIRFIYPEGKKAMPVEVAPVAFWPRLEGKGRVLNASGYLIPCDFEGGEKGSKVWLYTTLGKLYR